MNIYTPKETKNFLEKFLESSHFLNTMSSQYPSKCKTNIVEVEEGDKLTLKNEFFVNVIKCEHSINSVGYGIFHLIF